MENKRMNEKIKIIRKTIAVLLLFLCAARCGNLQAAASQTAADQDLSAHRGSISVTLGPDGRSESGGGFAVYQVAVLSESGNEFAYTDAFRDFAVSELTSGYSSEDGLYVAEDVFGADTEENAEANTTANRKMAEDLAAFISSGGSTVSVFGTLTLGDGTGNTQAGTGTFSGPSGEGLPAGLYLFVQEQPDADIQPVSPFLVGVPRLVNGAYVFDVDAYPKPGTVSDITPVLQVCPSVQKQIIGSGADPTMVTDVAEGTYFQFDFTALGTDDASDPDCPMPVNDAGSVADGGPVAAASSQTLRLQIGGTGTIPVGTITFTREGNYYYQVTERSGSDPDYDYDQRVYWLKYSVTPNADHSALEVSEYLVRDGNAEGEQLFPKENGEEPVFTFTNVQYQEAPGGNEGTEEEPTEPALDGNKGGNGETPGGGTSGGTSGGTGTSGTSVSGANSRTLPQTGQLWWPVWVLAGAGVILVLAGILIRRDRR